MGREMKKGTRMEYAVISVHNNQYLVKPGEKIVALGTLGQVGDMITDAKVLLAKDGEIKIGTPEVEQNVELKVVELSKTDKVDIFKYRGKSRYRRHTGHRQPTTILEVSFAGKAAAKKAAQK
jgi:large subunit ribosomal protein L21